GRSHYPRAVRATLSHGTMSTVVHRRAAGSATGYSVYHRTVAGRAPTVPVARQAAASWVARFPRAGRRGHQRDPPPARRSAVGGVVAWPAAVRRTRLRAAPWPGVAVPPAPAGRVRKQELRIVRPRERERPPRSAVTFPV